MKLPRVVKSKVDRVDYCDQKLKKKGYQMIGSGAYAEVWAMPKGDHVLKIGRCSPHMFEIDAYLSYLKAIPSNTRNPLFPKVDSIKLYKYSRYQGFYVVKLERLQSCIDDEESDWIHDVPTPESRKLLKSNGLRSVYDLEHPEKVLRKKKTVNRHVHQVCRMLQRLYRDHSEDIHVGNIMIRDVGGAKQLVLTDPIC